jgi:hypothetical protein
MTTAEWIGTVAWLFVAVIAYFIGRGFGLRRGIKKGFDVYAKSLRFERRNMTMIAPTDQPHSRNPRGKRARVTEAHISQVRTHWNE